MRAIVIVDGVLSRPTWHGTIQELLDEVGLPRVCVVLLPPHPFVDAQVIAYCIEQADPERHKPNVMVQGYPYPIRGPMVIVGQDGELHRPLTNPESMAYWLEPPEHDGGLPTLRVGGRGTMSTRAGLEGQGVLVSLDRDPFKAEAEKAGYRLPAAMTREIWDRYVEPTYEADPMGQEALLRVWDILWMSRQVLATQPNRHEGVFKLTVAGHGEVTLMMSIRKLDDGPYILISDPPATTRGPGEEPLGVMGS